MSRASPGPARTPGGLRGRPQDRYHLEPRLSGAAGRRSPLWYPYPRPGVPVHGALDHYLLPVVPEVTRSVWAGAGRGIRTLTSKGQQVLSLPRLPVPASPHILRQTSYVLPPISRCLRVAVRANQPQVNQPVVRSYSINMFQFKWNGLAVPCLPIALLTNILLQPAPQQSFL